MFQVPLALSGYDFDRLVIVILVVGAAVALVVMLQRMMRDPPNLTHVSIVTNERFELSDIVKPDWFMVVMSEPIGLREAMYPGSDLDGFGEKVLYELGEGETLPLPYPTAVVEGDETVEGVAYKCELKQLLCIGKLTDGRVVLIKVSKSRFAQGAANRPAARAWNMDKCHA